MSRVKVKNMPHLRLTDLLKRRKMTLENFIVESGVQTYEGLVIRCNRFGCLPPDEAEYKKLRPEIVNSPPDGVIVVDPFPLIEESTGRRIDPEAPVTVPEILIVIDDPQVDKSNLMTAHSDDEVLKSGAPSTPNGSRVGRRRKKEEPQ